MTLDRAVADVARALDGIKRRIAAAGRDPADTSIIAVTKGFGLDAVVAASAVGLTACGENYAQELLAKATAAGVPHDVEWHFLGAVQRNKVRALAPHVRVWQGVDRLTAAAEIARHAPNAAVLVQVNLSGDAARNGCLWDETGPLVAQAGELGLEVRGLMGVAAPVGASEQFERLAARAAELGLAECSMGMSGDLEDAVRAGATMVRVGTALFGARPRAAQARR